MFTNAVLSAGDVALINLGRSQCRFPVREDSSVTGGYLFCAVSTTRDRVYCDHHHGVVTAVETRRPRSGMHLGLRRAA
jgi:hypothetical protein